MNRFFAVIFFTPFVFQSEANAQLKRRVEPEPGKLTAPKVIYRDKAVEKSSEPVSSHNNLILKIVSDANCTIYVDGESRGIAEAGVAKKIAFTPGDYILRWVSTERKEAEGEKRLSYTKDDMGAQKLFEVKLSEQVDAIKENEERTLANKKLLEEVKKDGPQILAGIWENMVLVAGGSFEMGCTSEQSGCDGNEKPVHRVTVNNFYTGRYEVTQAQWAAIMGTNPSYFSGCTQCPVEQVSWEDIQEFLGKLNAQTGKSFRLPTEAEWEYAARGGNQSKGYQYSGSNDLGLVGWYESNSGFKSHPVGEKQSNELGLYDMSGNVWEWCSDWYNESYYESSPQSNPEGPGSGQYRVNRGGSWSFNPAHCPSAYRYGSTPGYRNIDLGFRLVHPSR